MQRAAREKVLLAVFPELGLSAYSCEDLFHQQALLDAAEAALARAPAARRERCALAAVVGLPLARRRTALQLRRAVCRGRLLGVVPKTYLPNYREFYEGAAVHARRRRALRRGRSASASDVPFGTDLMFRHAEQPRLRRCTSRSARTSGCRSRRRRSPRWPARRCCANLSASNITVGKADYRRQLVGSQSARCLAAYLYSAARARRIDHRPGLGRPRADLRERQPAGRVGALRRPSRSSSLADVDLEPPARQERMRQNTFGDAALRHRDDCARFRQRRSSRAAAAGRPRAARAPRRALPVRAARPGAPRRALRRGLSTSRCRASPSACALTGIKKLVIGVSGGLDSTQALLVCARAMDGWAAARATSSPTPCPASPPARAPRTRRWQLMRAVGCYAPRRSTSGPRCLQMLKDIGHPFARASRSTTSPSRTCRPASAPATCSAWPTCTAASSSAPATSRELALGWCDLRRRRPHVALQRQRQRAEDADPAPDRAGSPRPSEFGARRAACAAARARDRDQPRAGAGAGKPAQSTESVGRPVRAAGLPPLLHAALRLRADARSRSSPTAWRDARRGTGLTSPRRAPRIRPGRDQAHLALPEALLPDQPVQAQRHAERARRSAPAARSRRAATGARPSDGNADAWLRNLDQGTEQVVTGRRPRTRGAAPGSHARRAG